MVGQRVGTVAHEAGDGVGVIGAEGQVARLRHAVKAGRARAIGIIGRDLHRQAGRQRRAARDLKAIGLARRVGQRREMEG